MPAGANWSVSAWRSSRWKSDRRCQSVVEIALLVAVGLLVAGVIASVIPMVPGALLSLAGILGYWWWTGFAEPGTVFVAVAVIVGITALVLDYLSSFISAKVSGASTKTAIIAGAIGLVALVFTGPVGALLAVLLTVFAIEFRRSDDVNASLRMAGITTLGMLASTGVQLLLTTSLLVAFLVVIIL